MQNDMSKFKQFWKSRTPVLIILSFDLLLLFYNRDLHLFFSPDPPKAQVYATSFSGLTLRKAPHIVHDEGFRSCGSGLELAPGGSGQLVLKFVKREHQGSLVRVWLYGDDGARRPNAMRISVDNGTTYETVAENGNYVNAVFDISQRVVGFCCFRIMFEAANRSPLFIKALDRVEVVITDTGAARPALPGFASVAGLVLAAYLICLLVKADSTEQARVLLQTCCAGILLLAAYVRWQELVRMAGTALYPDAQGYLAYAQEMSLFSARGFYSAAFGAREPLFILLAKTFISFFGVSETHLRFASFLFSLVVVGLTCMIGKRWLHPVAGLCAAAIVAVHPLLISMSARGLREEWFTTLLLLFIYCGYVKHDLKAGMRMLAAGLLVGALLLTRLDAFGMLVCMLAGSAVLARLQWSPRAAAGSLIIGALLVAPHLVSTYRNHGDPLYALNRHAAFYRNLEFVNQPGFPTQDEIDQRGMYTGPRITPFEYLFKLHTPWELIRDSAIGFVKIHLYMPLGFGEGRGNLQEVKHAAGALRKDFRSPTLNAALVVLSDVMRRNWLSYTAACTVTLLFLSGLVLAAFSSGRLLYLLMICFQLQTAFLASRGLDYRLTVHSYPLIALFCGYTVYRLYYRLKLKLSAGH